jgi:Raf kinase inhibitor-like YbhB/YbcL family protein
MHLTSRKIAGAAAIVSVAAGLLSARLLARDDDWAGGFRVTSRTFRNNSTLPISTIHNNIVNNVNTCSVNGSPGGNQSPELSWTGVPDHTESFVVVAYDVTASFTHWGMYNISGNEPGLPANAGAPGGTYGTQVYNDFFIAPEYDGPCPPANVAPFVHHYVFTVYALDIKLDLPGSTNFPANAETLYQALIDAGQKNHILASASITGLYSTTP